MKRARAPRPVALRDRTNGTVSSDKPLSAKIEELSQDLTQTNLSAEERKKLKKKLKKQRQKQRKKGALEEVTESQFDVLRLPDGTVARCSLQGMIAANFEDDAVPSTPEPLQDEIQRMVLRVADDVEEGSLRARVAFVAPWAKVYGALGPDHRRKPYVPEALDRAQWRCALDGADGRETAVFAVRGDGREPQTDRVLARAAATALACTAKTPTSDSIMGLADPTLLSAWTVRFDPSRPWLS